MIGYHLWEGSAPGQENILAGVVTGGPLTVILTLHSGTAYFFVVTAYNSAGDSLPSNEVSLTTPP